MGDVDRYRRSGAQLGAVGPAGLVTALTTTVATARVGAREIIDHFLDADTFVSWDVAPIQLLMSPEYTAALAQARERTGLDEAIISGEGRLRGRRVAVVADEFGFLGGSIGVAATHKAAGLPYLVYLRSPTTGGVLASWGSLGHLTVAEPGALVGFLGPRVYQVLYGEPFPEGVQTAENLYAHGLLDAVLPASELPKIVHRVLNVLLAPRFRRGDSTTEESSEPHDADDAWTSITRSRRPDRPSVRRLLRIAATDVTPLNGTGTGEVDPGILLALARFDGAPCVLLGQETGGGALALVPADRVIAARHGWLSPLPPEGASAIIHRDITHAAEMATEQGVRSADLLAAGMSTKLLTSARTQPTSRRHSASDWAPHWPTSCTG